MKKELRYESDRPLRRLELGDEAEISVTHFPDTIVKERDRKKYGHFQMVYIRQSLSKNTIYVATNIQN